MKTLFTEFFARSLIDGIKFRSMFLSATTTRIQLHPAKTQETFDAELGNLAPDTISMSRPLDPTNAHLSVLSDLVNRPIPETRKSKAKENHAFSVRSSPNSRH